MADIKQRYIPNIIEAARKCEYIDKVVLFGSSLEDRCKEQSDIDLAVFGNLPRGKCLVSKKFREFYRQLILFDDLNQAYDVLYFKTGKKDTSLIMQEIESGEVLYEKQNPHR
jgi:predicted nucleotidyltransferase